MRLIGVGHHHQLPAPVEQSDTSSQAGSAGADVPKKRPSMMKRPAASDGEYAPLLGADHRDDHDDEADDGPAGGGSESDIPSDLRSGGGGANKRPAAKTRGGHSKKKPAAAKKHEFGEEPILHAFHAVVFQKKLQKTFFPS